MRSAVIIPCLVLISLTVAAWLTDFITLKGERTVYAANCKGGNWRGETCTGKLAAGERYRFRVLKAHNEVLYWTAGKEGTLGKLTDCVITSGRNWRCQPTVSPVNTVALEIFHGKVVPRAGANIVGAHLVSKARWYVLWMRMPIGTDAES